MTFFYRTSTFLLITFFSVCASAQNAAIGFWDSHLPYNTSVGVVTDGNMVYSICNQAFFSYNSADGQEVSYSKTDGMSDIGMQCGGYDKTTKTLVLVYNSGSIDLFRNNNFYNIPDLKRIAKPEEKKIYQVYAENGYAYLCTSIGVVVIDLDKEEIEKTYKFQVDIETVPVYGFSADSKYFYAVTRTGLYRGDKNSPMLQNTSAWTNLYKKDTFSNVVNVDDVLYLANKRKIYAVAADSVRLIYTSPKNIQHISAGKDNLLIGVSDSKGGIIKLMDKGFNIVDSFDCEDSTVQAAQTTDDHTWVATPKHGLKKRSGTETESIVPDGPSNPNAYSVYANNRIVYVAHGGYNSSYFAASSYDGFSKLKDGKWTYYRHGDYTPLNGLRDFSSLAVDELTGTLYAGSYLNGLFILHKDGSSEIINNGSLFDGSIAYGSDYHQVIGLTLDKHSNLWVTSMFSPHQLYVKAKDGTWSKYRVPGITFGGGPVAVDDNGQVWITDYYGGGVTAINTRNTVNDTSDDEVFHFTAGKEFGNLPSPVVGCVARDVNNDIWVGTENGIAIFKGCIVNGSAKLCDAEIPIVHYDQYSGPLFAGEYVKVITLDATGNKWIGTRNSGAWLISADAQTVIHHFTKDNSPLPSNYIREISIDKVTGDVYIGTDQGLVSYHGAATEGGTSNKDVLAFPNPVPGDYTGTIAIRGLVDNADVRITDISGNLIYHGRAQGGQVVWNGKDYTGHRPQSGVYLFFVTDKDGKQTYTGKIIFIQ